MDLQDRLFGAGFLAVAAAVAGQLGPQIGIPEEVVTVPAASVVGFAVGMKRIENFIPI